jgi:hypothetical protein
MALMTLMRELTLMGEAEDDHGIDDADEES